MHYYWAVVQQYTAERPPLLYLAINAAHCYSSEHAAALGIVDRHIHGEGVCDKNIALQIARSY